MNLRFWSKVKKGDECWEWTGARIRTGYGRIFWRGKVRYAHRVSLEMTGEVVPDDCIVMHSCDNPSCVNPAHLSVGTQTENMRDAAQKGRLRIVADWSGVKNPKSKLTDSEREEIRKSSENAQILAERFGVTKVRIYQIRKERQEVFE